jgi:hypothetical protein
VAATHYSLHTTQVRLSQSYYNGWNPGEPQEGVSMSAHEEQQVSLRLSVVALKYLFSALYVN